MIEAAPAAVLSVVERQHLFSKVGRSILLVPGHDERKLKRCRDFGADRVLLDLEDGVPEESKDEARKMVLQHARDGDIVRISSLLEDAEVAESLPAGVDVMLAKWSGYLPVKRPCIPCVESPAGVLAIESLARSSGRREVVAVAWGAHDFLALVGDRARRGGALEAHAMARVSIAASSLGVPAIDSPSASRNLQVVESEARLALALGYTAKGCMMPSHVPVVNGAMRHLEDDGMRLLAAGEDDGDYLAMPPIRKAAERLTRAT